jgi:signal transduction histidine kinase
VSSKQALARARDDAEAANRAKSAFLANTSHELRTPLNGMIGLARMARMPDIGEERRRQYLDQIADSAQALAGIISDILDLSKIEAGKLQLGTVCTFDLGELLRRLQQSYTTLAAAHGLRCTWRSTPACRHGQRRPAARAPDHQQLPQQRAEVHRARPDQPAGAPRQRDGDTVRVEVRDTGPGIDAATRARLFEPFTQADQSTTRRFGGTGLGLVHLPPTGRPDGRQRGRAQRGG